ncbi:hypothetical protein J4E91_006515 [Alternaria rosae]|nr:hypothetical protein J4E91_006515 [Alternaria rosae]
MTFFAPQLQIVSDLHLETPMNNPQYSYINLQVTGSALLLLGDIGLVSNDGLFTFLRNLLDQNRGCRIFYVLGNHEAYQTTLGHAVNQMRDFENTAKQDYGGHFRLLFRDRYDLNENVTILGCTLWSNIQPEQAAEVGSRMTDYNEERGIQDWTPERSYMEHARDLAGGKGKAVKMVAVEQRGARWEVVDKGQVFKQKDEGKQDEFGSAMVMATSNATGDTDVVLDDHARPKTGFLG